MGGNRHARILRTSAGTAALLGMGLLLSGCGSTSLNSMTGGLVGSPPPPPTTTGPAAGVGVNPPAPSDQDLPCPDTAVRTGAATLIVGKTAGQEQPSPLDVQYQGSIVRMARECHVIAGTMHIKVGVEGRIITGPAGGIGNLTVPLRVAVVREGVNPVTITTDLAQIPVAVNNTVDRVAFTHVYPDLAFPLPRPIGALDNYTIYVGFDPIGAQSKRPARHRRTPRRRH